MTTRNYTYKSYAMEYGTFVGLTWGGLFFSYVEGIAGNNGMLMMLCFMLCGVSIFLDDGQLMDRMNELLTQPEMVSTYEQMGMGEQRVQMMDVLREADGLSSWEKTLLIFNNNFFFSIILSFFVAGVAKRS